MMEYSDKELAKIVSIGVADGLWRFFWSVVGVVFLFGLVAVIALVVVSG